MNWIAEQKIQRYTYSTASERVCDFVGIMYSSRLILLYSGHSGDRQTIEYLFVSTYGTTAGITSRYAHFRGFNFAEADELAKMAQKKKKFLLYVSPTEYPYEIL